MTSPESVREGATSPTSSGFHGIMEQQFEQPHFDGASGDGDGSRHDGGAKSADSPNYRVSNSVRLKAGDLHTVSSPLAWMLLVGAEGPFDLSGEPIIVSAMDGAPESERSEDSAVASEDESLADVELGDAGEDQSAELLQPLLAIVAQVLPTPLSTPRHEASLAAGQSAFSDVVAADQELVGAPASGALLESEGKADSDSAEKPAIQQPSPIEQTVAADSTDRPFLQRTQGLDASLRSNDGASAEITHNGSSTTRTSRSESELKVATVPGTPGQTTASGPEAFALRVDLKASPSPAPQADSEIDRAVEGNLAEDTPAGQAYFERQPIADPPAELSKRAKSLVAREGAPAQQNFDDRHQNAPPARRDAGTDGEQPEPHDNSATGNLLASARQAGNPRLQFEHGLADAVASSVPVAPGGDHTTDAAAVPVPAPAMESSPWTTRVWETARREMNGVSPHTPMREIDLRLPVENQLVDIQLRERSGLLDVSVRTSDPVLAKEMRADLGELVRNLESQGYDAAPKGFDDGLMVRHHDPSASPSGDGNADAASNGGAGQEAGSGQGRRQNRQQRHKFAEDLPFSVEGADGNSISETAFQGGSDR